MYVSSRHDEAVYKVAPTAHVYYAEAWDRTESPSIATRIFMSATAANIFKIARDRQFRLRHARTECFRVPHRLRPTRYVRHRASTGFDCVYKVDLTELFSLLRVWDVRKAWPRCRGTLRRRFARRTARIVKITPQGKPTWKSPAKVVGWRSLRQVGDLATNSAVHHIS